MKQMCVGSVLRTEGQLRGAHNACTWTQKTHARCDFMKQKCVRSVLQTEGGAHNASTCTKGASASAQKGQV